MFENRVLRRIFGHKRDEVTGKWRQLHSEELHDLYPSPNIIRVIKSRRMRWAGHVACKGRREMQKKNFVGIPERYGDRGSTVVKVLCYKSEGRWFDPRWCHMNFSLT